MLVVVKTDKNWLPRGSQQFCDIDIVGKVATISVCLLQRTRIIAVVSSQKICFYCDKNSNIPCLMFLALKKYPTSGYFMVIQDISGQQWQLTRYYHFLSQQLLWSTVYCNRQFFCVEWLLGDANPWNKAGVLICSLNFVVYQLVCGHCCKLLQWSTYIAEMALGVD